MRTSFRCEYLYQHMNRGMSEGYIVALSIAVSILAIGGGEAYALYKAKWRPWVGSSSEPALASATGTATGKKKRR